MEGGYLGIVLQVMYKRLNYDFRGNVIDCIFLFKIERFKVIFSFLEDDMGEIFEQVFFCFDFVIGELGIFFLNFVFSVIEVVLLRFIVVLVFIVQRIRCYSVIRIVYWWYIKGGFFQESLGWIYMYIYV